MRRTDLNNLLHLLRVGAFLAVIFWMLSVFGAQNIERQEESLRLALERDIVQCYALEGSYPPDLAYIEEHYGLTYDHRTFFVDYRPIGDNLYPDVTILRLGSKKP